MKAYILAVCALLCSCVTKQSMESNTDIHQTEAVAQRMDSLVHAFMTWQQRIYEKQTALTDSFRHTELRDTSRTFFLNTHGDTIREKTIIYLERNTDHTSKESTTERLEEQLVRTDSMLRVSLDRQEKLELLLRDHEKNTVVEKKPPWYQRLLAPYSMLMTLAVFVLIVLVRRKKGRL